MKKRFVILYILIFIIVGELIVRIDKKFLVLNNDPVKIDTKIEETAIKRQVDNGIFVLDTNQVRILILGDSYIHGGGINSRDKFSKKLGQILVKSGKITENVCVLDISRPSNNTMDNYNSFTHYKSQFKPHIVFWAYNFNDILGGIEFNQLDEAEKHKKDTSPPKRLSKERQGLKGFVNSFYRSSELSRFLSTKMQQELKIKGIILPFGDFYYLTNQAYLGNQSNWKETQNILADAATWSESNQAKFILYKMPEFNLLEVDDLFSKIDKSFESFVKTNKNIIYINGRKYFPEDNGDQFLISKHDGHPNTLAHKIIAERIAFLVEELLLETD